MFQIKFLFRTRSAPQTPPHLASSIPLRPTTKILALGLTLVLAFLFVSFLQGEGDSSCGECPNPLVEVKLAKEGKISDDALKLLNEKAAKEFGEFGGEVFVFEVMMRGFEFLEFKKRNPCADLYYIEHRPPDYRVVRHGMKEGQAKYEIRSTIDVTKAKPGEQAMVKQVIYDEKGNEVSQSLASVPKLGNIRLRHELVCLKNNEVYDEGELNLDWIDNPPENEDYFLPDQGSDGICIGAVTRGDLSSSTIFFNQGDVGVTIRKMETPAGFTLNIEEQLSNRSTYFLKISEIINQLGKKLPANIYVALRTKHGHLQGGKKVGEWHIYKTSGGAIPSPVLYQPPECAQGRFDMLEMAAYCDWHADEPEVGSVRASQKIPLLRCFNNLVLTASVSRYSHFFHSKKAPIIPQLICWEEKVDDEYFQVNLTITFNRRPKEVVLLSDNLVGYTYTVKSVDISGQHIYKSAHTQEKEWLMGRMIKSSFDRYARFGQAIDLHHLDDELAFVYDTKRDEIREVKNLPAFECLVAFRMEDYSQYYDADTGSKTDFSSDQWEEYWGPIISEWIPEEGVNRCGPLCLSFADRKREDGEEGWEEETRQWRLQAKPRFGR